MRSVSGSWGSVRRECLDHLLILGEAHIRLALRRYVAYFNTERSHHGIAQHFPVPGQTTVSVQEAAARVEAVPVLGGPHHAYRRVA
jgi:hypothetical protein